MENELKFKMTILDKNILPQHGPYVDFAVLDVPPGIPEDGWLAPEEYEAGLFFELADDLLGCYCSITRSYSPFDPHGLTQLTTPQELYEFIAKLLLWELQIAKTPVFYFNRALDDLYGSAERRLEANNITPEKLKANLLETLHFVIGHLNQAAASGKCVVIVGF